MEPTTSFGYWLRRRRKALDLTQGELAMRVGCVVTTIKKLEADERRPSKQLAERLADHLGISSEERVAFLKAARAEQAADRLAVATQPLASPLETTSRLPPTPSLPTGTLTFLFTDIEGSTQLWEQHPQAMPATIEHHNSILKAVIATHGGAVFKLVGDAVYAAFASAPDALAAVLAAQRVLVNEHWGATGPLRVRMALHTGTAEVRDGDYLGLPLNRVARLLAAGHGGQILLSLATKELVRDQLPDDTVLRDLGAHRLKDLVRPESIFQVVVPDLPTEFPPLNTLDIRRTNLPAPSTPLIGREHEVQQVGELLRKAGTRLVTLTGPGGTGKTRLGLHVAAELLEDFPDGVWLVELAPLADPALVPQAIATVLGVREEPDRPLRMTLNAFLRDKQLLLVLDNCEHLIEACAQAAESVMLGCPLLHILASSREPLGIAGETIVRVPPLAVPDPRQALPLDQLMCYEAVQLFVERALVVQPDFRITSQNAPAIVQICDRLDGIPLAIELAAARARAMAVEQIAARLDDRFRLLTGGSRTALPRQQTLQALIDWSYDLLTEHERGLLRRLAVFAGGWTLEAAEAVCASEGTGDVLEPLIRLVDKSLVQVEPGGDAVRYRVLETIRQYALEKLTASGEADAVRQRHAEYYLTWDAPDLWRTRTRLNHAEQEHANFRAALSWSQSATGNLELGVILLSELLDFWWSRGHWSEARSWLESALALANQQQVGHTQSRARALYALGFIYMMQGDYLSGQVYLADSLRLFQELGDTKFSAWALHSLGVTARDHGDAATAQARLEESLALLQAIGDRRHIAMVLITLGEVAVLQEDVARATRLLEQGLAMNPEVEGTQNIGWALNHLGHVAQLQGEYGRAAQLHEEGLALFRELGVNLGIAWALESLGEVALAHGDIYHATEYFAESLRVSQSLTDRAGIAWCLAGLGSVAALDEEPERAVRLWGAAEALRLKLGARTAPAARANYERAVATTRTQLGEDAFAAAWAEGSAMSLEEAIAYALEQ